MGAANNPHSDRTPRRRKQLPLSQLPKHHSPMNRKTLAITLLAAFAALIALFVSGLGQNPQELPSVTTGKALPAINLPALESDQQRHTSADLPQGEPYLLNIWGSWCPACHDEHPYLLQLGKTIPIVGINWPADNPNEIADATAFLARHGNPYRLNLRDANGTLITDLGVYGAPETYLIAADGTIQHRYAGALTPQVWQEQFQPLLKHP